jgi:hypothetical protein
MSKARLIQTINERADYKVKTMRAGRKWMNSAPMAKILSSLDYLAEKYGAAMDPYFDGTYNSVYLTLKQLNGLKDESLAALLNSLLHHEPDTVTSEDEAHSFSRVYRYRWISKDPEFYGTFTVNVTANFKEDSETCKRVVVGYREPSKEATPIYELRCNEDTPAETQE